MRGLDPRIHQFASLDPLRWIAGSSPAKTMLRGQTTPFGRNYFAEPVVALGVSILIAEFEPIIPVP
jgi:hypothetical protein